MRPVFSRSEFSAFMSKYRPLGKRLHPKPEVVKLRQSIGRRPFLSAMGAMHPPRPPGGGHDELVGGFDAFQFDLAGMRML
jgi:hypothetical protein